MNMNHAVEKFNIRRSETLKKQQMLVESKFAIYQDARQKIFKSCILLRILFTHIVSMECCENSYTNSKKQIYQLKIHELIRDTYELLQIHTPTYCCVYKSPSRNWVDDTLIRPLQSTGEAKNITISNCVDEYKYNNRMIYSSKIGTQHVLHVSKKIALSIPLNLVQMPGDTISLFYCDIFYYIDLQGKYVRYFHHGVPMDKMNELLELTKRSDTYAVARESLRLVTDILETTFHDEMSDVPKMS